MVARRHRVHPAVRVPAVPRRLRRRLRLGARRELSRLSGPALHFHTGLLTYLLDYRRKTQKPPTLLKGI